MRTYTVCGTPEYMAPEQVLSRGHDRGVDYWALGCMMYEMICGYTPFVGGDQMEIYENIVSHEKRDDKLSNIPIYSDYDPDYSDSFIPGKDIVCNWSIYYEFSNRRILRLFDGILHPSFTNKSLTNNDILT